MQKISFLRRDKFTINPTQINYQSGAKLEALSDHWLDQHKIFKLTLEFEKANRETWILWKISKDNISSKYH